MNAEFHPEADRELSNAALFYEQELAGLGEQFVDEVEDACKLLAENQGIGQTLSQDLRRFVLNRFPFSLIYSRGVGKPFILAVAHQRRKPGYWNDRVNR